MTPNNSSTVTIDQTNTQDISTVIYDGLVVASSDQFHPTITLRPAPNAVPPSNANVTLVAESLSFVRNGTNATLISILEFSPQNYSAQQPLSWKPLAGKMTTPRSFQPFPNPDFACCTNRSVDPWIYGAVNGCIKWRLFIYWRATCWYDQSLPKRCGV
jgi:hypothetical protein